MLKKCLLTLSPDDTPRWIRLCVHPIGERWAAMILGDDEPPPGPGELRGLGFFGETTDEAEQAAKRYLGCSEPAN